MTGRVQFDCVTSDQFPTNRGVKQSCVLTPTLFGIYISFVIQSALVNADKGESLLTRDDGNFFSFSRFKAKSMVQKVVVLLMQMPQYFVTPCPRTCRSFLIIFPSPATTMAWQSAWKRLWYYSKQMAIRIKYQQNQSRKRLRSSGLKGFSGFH